MGLMECRTPKRIAPQPQRNESVPSFAATYPQSSSAESAEVHTIFTSFSSLGSGCNESDATATACNLPSPFSEPGLLCSTEFGNVCLREVLPGSVEESVNLVEAKKSFVRNGAAAPAPRMGQHPTPHISPNLPSRSGKCLTGGGSPNPNYSSSFFVEASANASFPPNSASSVQASSKPVSSQHHRD